VAGFNPPLPGRFWVTANTQGVALAAGDTKSIRFVTRIFKPGTYVMLVNNIPAGSLIIEDSVNPDFILITSCVAILTSLALAIMYIRRRQC